MELLRFVNATIGFLFELFALIAYGMWGYSLGTSSSTKWLLAIVFSSLFVGLWAFCFAPDAALKLPMPWIGIAAGSLFIGAALAIRSTLSTTLLWVVILLVIVHSILTIQWKQW